MIRGCSNGRWCSHLGNDLWLQQWSMMQPSWKVSELASWSFEFQTWNKRIAISPRNVEVSRFNFGRKNYVYLVIKVVLKGSWSSGNFSHMLHAILYEYMRWSACNIAFSLKKVVAVGLPFSKKNYVRRIHSKNKRLRSRFNQESQMQ